MSLGKNNLSKRGAALRFPVKVTHQANGPSMGHGSVDLGTLTSTKSHLRDPYVLSNPFTILKSRGTQNKYLKFLEMG